MPNRRLVRALVAWRYPILILLLAAGALVASRLRGEVEPPRDLGTYYEQGLEAYRAGDFQRALERLGRGYALDEGDVGINTLLGWSHWRLADVKRARFHFERALERDRSSVDAQTGLAYSSLAQDDLATALPLLVRLSAAAPADHELAVSLANAYVRSGSNRQAAATYRTMLARDSSDQVARRELLALYGFPEYQDDLPLDLATRPRPARFEQWFRARGDYLQAFDGSAWRDVYLAGVNLGPARPGEFPSTVSREFAPYEQWLREMAVMNVNTVRVYTILPPAFYRALEAHNRKSHVPLWLVQEVWINDDAQDLYDERIEREFTSDLERVIDVLHGQGDVPFRPGAQHGIYTADVSRWVIGLAVGREVEAHLALRTNARHPDETSHAGRYVSLERGSPAEAWFARMCDRAADYELTRYNTQRPLTVVNWPPLDPLSHVSESSFLEEIGLRQAHGEPVSADTFELPDFPNDSDAVSLDVTKFRAAPGFDAGLFALYHVYQHWPDFLFKEPAFARASDAQGPNRHLGYLRELKRVHRNMPLVVGEYGLATSLGIAHVHPDGWHNGGFTERAQADLLVRFTDNQRGAGAAGSIVFAWKDEWWKRVADHFTSPFEVPRDRDPYWFNVLDPEEAFGLIGYEPEFVVPRLRGRREDWERAEPLGARPGEGGALRGVSAMVDYAYLHLRIDLAPGAIDWRERSLWIALNTLPGESGSRTLPAVSLRAEPGVNFLVQLDGPEAARLLVAENYWPLHRVPVAGTNGETRIDRRTAFTPGIGEAAPFVEMITEANQRRFGRDGVFHPAQDVNRSPLLHGTADRDSREYSDHALWRADPAAGLIELRIPWGLILVTDPSSRAVFAGTDGQGAPTARETSGVSVAVLLVSAGESPDRRIIASLPRATATGFESAPPVFAWRPWDEVRARPYFKRSYEALSAVFSRIGPVAHGTR
jgi:tetratricopeptide (TPR) repeat protein